MSSFVHCRVKIRSTAYSEGGSDSGKVKRTRRGDREGRWFGVESLGAGPSVPNGNEPAYVCPGLSLAGPLDL
jgi:hypothetical protein